MSRLFSFFRFNKPLFVRALLLSSPIMLGSLGIVLMGVTDVLMLGKYSPEDQSAAAVSNGLFFLVTIFGMGVLFAISALISNAIGEKNKKVVFSIFQKGIIVSILMALVSVVLLILVSENFTILKQDESIVPQGVAYLRMVALSVFPLYLFVAARQLTDGLGFTGPALYVTLLALPLNIFANYIFIYGNFGGNEMGAEGAAFASLITRSFMAVALLAYIYTSKRIKEYRSSENETSVTLMAIFSIGVPIGLQFLYEVGLFAVAKIFAGMLGVAQLAAHEIALSLASVTFMVAAGLSAGGAIMIGNANGEKNPFKMKRVANVHYAMILIFMVFCASIFWVFNKSLAGMFTLDHEVMQLASIMLIYVAAFQIFDGVATVSMGLLRGAKDVSYASYVALVMYVIFGISCSYYFAFYTPLGLHGLWLGLTLSLVGSSILLIRRFYKVICLFKKGC